MTKLHVILCGSAGGRARAVLERSGIVGLRLSAARDSYDLPGIDPTDPPDMLIANGYYSEDPIFKNWRRRRSTTLQVIWIVKKRDARPRSEGDGEGIVLPESDLAALPYMVEFALREKGRPATDASERSAKPDEGPVRRIVGRSRAIQKVIASARKVLNVNSSVLVLGESGTGKELVASMVHRESARLNKPFVKVNCAAIPETLLESELFGIERRIATGVDRRIGKFEQAHGGTIFLDEIGDMTLFTQAKILRILQEKEFERVGGTESIRVDARIIAATNKDLSVEIAAGRFRSDLFYRLNVINIRIPPLRERREDIPDLVRHFVDTYSRENSLPRKKVPDDIMNVLMQYEWPGNVRELENAVERAVVIGDEDQIRRHDLPATILNALNLAPESPENPDSFNTRVADFERSLLIDALERCNWVQARAARKLGMSERSMWHLFKKYNLEELKAEGRGRRRGRRQNPMQERGTL